MKLDADRQTSTAPARSTTTLWQQLCEDTSTRDYRFGTHRAISPSATLRRILPLLGRAGITRLADLTRLDWIGIPVYQATRPNSRNVSLSHGKGLTRAQAQVSALMESLELFHAEEIAQPTIQATIRSIRRELDYDPYGLALSKPSWLTDETRLEWVAGTDLWNGSPTWVPRRLVELNFCLEERLYANLFWVTSNGLASGNTVAEALLHGLCEVLERGAIWRGPRPWSDPERVVRQESIYSRSAQRVLQQLAQARMRTHVADLSGPTGVPCFQAWLDHPDGPGLMTGFGCHPSRLTALLRALTEAAQGRAAHIAGSHDPLRPHTYRGPLSPWRPDRFQVADGEPRRSFRSAPKFALAGFRAQVKDIVGRVRALTGMSPLAVDLSRPDFGIPVVFVVAPGLHAPTRP